MAVRSTIEEKGPFWSAETETVLAVDLGDLTHQGSKRYKRVLTTPRYLRLPPSRKSAERTINIFGPSCLLLI